MARPASLLLRQDDCINARSGLSVSFHVLRERQSSSASVAQAANVLFHALGESGRSLDHHHEFYEILLMLRGDLRHWVNGQSQRLDTGSLILLRPADRHHFEIVEKTEDEPVELVNLAVSPELFKQTLEFLGLREWNRWIGRAGRGLPLHVRLLRSEADDLSLQMLRFDSRQLTHPEQAVTEGRLLIANLVGRLQTDGTPLLRALEPQGANLPSWLTELCQQLEEAESLIDIVSRLPQLSRRSHAYVCKSFRRHLGTTPTDFVNAIRVRRAAKTLLENPDKILAIASDLGFQSLSHFHKLFRLAYGTSPARYRQLARANRIPG